jgi:hypothetical protein
LPGPQLPAHTVGLGTRGKSGGLLVPHVDPLDAALAPQRVDEPIQRVTDDTVDPFDAGLLERIDHEIGNSLRHGEPRWELTMTFMVYRRVTPQAVPVLNDAGVRCARPSTNRTPALLAWCMPTGLSPFREWSHVQYQPPLPAFSASDADDTISFRPSRNKLLITPAPSVCTGAHSVDRSDAAALFSRDLPLYGLIAPAGFERSLECSEALALSSLVQRREFAGVLCGGERT